MKHENQGSNGDSRTFKGHRYFKLRIVHNGNNHWQKDGTSYLYYLILSILEFLNLNYLSTVNTHSSILIS